MKRILLILVLTSLLIGCAEEAKEQATEEKEATATQAEDPKTPAQAGTETCIDKLNERCAGPPGLECLESSFSTDIITFSVINALGSTLELTDFDSYDEEEPWSCMTKCEVESVEVSVEGSESVDIGNHPQIANAEAFEIKLRCSGTEYIDQGFELSYTNMDNSMDHTGYFRITAIEFSGNTE